MKEWDSTLQDALNILLPLLRLVVGSHYYHFSDPLGEFMVFIPTTLALQG